MNLELQFIDARVGPGEVHIAYDHNLFRELSETSVATLHIYRWDRPGITYGYFSKPFLFLDPVLWKEKGYFSSKRPTGGGILFHEGDIGIGFSFPLSIWDVLKPLENAYFEIHRAIANSVFTVIDKKLELIENAKDIDLPFFKGSAKGTFCQASYVRGDGCFNGKKVLGGALRTGKYGALYEGSLQMFASPSLSVYIGEAGGLYPHEDEEVFKGLQKELTSELRKLISRK